VFRSRLPVVVRVDQGTWIEVDGEMPVRPTLDEHHLD